MAGQLIKRGEKKYIVRIYMGRDASGKRQYANHTVSGTKDDAQKYLNAALRSRDLGEFDPKRGKHFMGELFDLVLNDYREKGKRIDWAQIVIEKHLRPHFGKMKISAVGSAAIREFKRISKEKGHADSTVNRSLQFLKRAFHLGRKETPPLVGAIPDIPMFEESKPRQGFFERDEFKALRAALPEDLRALVTAAYCTGCRKGELLKLRWEQVDLTGRFIRLNPRETKNKEGRAIPMVPELADMLALERAKRDQNYPECPFVFSRNGKPIKWLHGSWTAACKSIGLVDAKGKPTKLFHDLRRTGVRNLRRAGVDEQTAMAISGHRTTNVFRRYNITKETDLRRAADLLAEHEANKDEQAAHRHTIGTQTKNLAIQ